MIPVLPTLIAAALPAVQQPEIAFPEPSPETRPWGICHLLGNAVEEDELVKEMKRWADAGLGGVRFVPIYGAKGYEQKNIEFMSPAFVGMMKTANRLAAENGMKIDLSFGAGWCFGGKTTTGELGAQGLKVVKPGDKLPKRYKVLFEKDGTRLISYHTGQKVKRTQAMDAGPMLNPFSPAALKAHLELFKNLDGETAAYPRATFHDSFEYYNAAWSDEFPALFRKYRGYSIEDHYAELAGFGDPENVARVKCDYRETLSDILSKETFPLWTEWCRERGMLTHNQAHGAPANLLEFYALADTPETEMFGRGKRDPLKSGYDGNFRDGDRNPLMSKFASSAAHLTGRKYTSAESFTWMSEHFCETLEEMKAFGDLLFLAGVNRLYYHATVYSPDSAPWPGWCFYASSELNPRNPLWRDIKPLNDYFARVETLLAEAAPDNDVLLYWPIYDQWTKADGFAELLTVHAHWMEELPFGRLAQRLDDAGYSFDYVTDAFLDDETVSRYKAIVVPETKFMKRATLARLAELSKKMPVLFEKSLPKTSPGLVAETLDLSAAPAPVEDAAAALAATGAIRDAFAAKGSPFDALRLSWNGGKLYFVVNSSMDYACIRLHPDAEYMDPLNGFVSREEGPGAGSPEIEKVLRIAPAHSFFVWSKAPLGDIAAGGVAQPAFKEIQFSSPWTLEFMNDVSGWELPAKRESDAIGDWTKFGEKEAEFSGTAVYRATFDMPEDGEAGRRVLLRLGEVYGTARIKLNGETVATSFMHPFGAMLAPKRGRNTLEVEVTNLAANRIRAYDLKGVKWKTFEDANMYGSDYKPLDASKWPVQPAGLAGPVRLEAVDAGTPAPCPATWPDGSAVAPWFADRSPVDEARLGPQRRAGEFGAVPDAVALQTKVLQGAIDAIAADGGGVLVLGPGVWNSSSLFFKPGVHLKIEKGGVLRGPADGAATPRLMTRMEGQSVVYNAALVNADRCDGFTLYGEGTIDGNGRATWEAFWEGRAKEKGFANMKLPRPRNVYVSNSKDVRVSGLSIKDAHYWTTHFYKCERVKIDNVRITAPGPENPPKAPSSDAVDLDVVKDVVVWNSWFDVNDDGFALKGGKYYQCEKLPENGANENILVERCGFGPVTHSAMTCGSEAIHCRNIMLIDCDMQGCGNLLNLKSRPDTVQLYEYILVERATGHCRNVVQMKPWTQYFTLPEGVGKQPTVARDIEFRNCRVEGAKNISIDETFMELERLVGDFSAPRP